MSSDQKSLLGHLRGLLRYHGILGIETYPKNQACERLLRWQPPTSAAPPAVVVSGVVAKAGGAGRGEDAAGPPPPSLGEIAMEVAACQACELHRLRLYPVPGRGSERVRVMVVGEWLMAEKEGLLPPGHVFGVEQDAMLARMFAAINLPMAEVFVTNAIKCALPPSDKPEERELASCRSHLLRQMAAVRPEVILAMGSAAARSVLGASINFTRIRGKIRYLQDGEGGKVAVLATYHPTFLLQNADMKPVAWADLQLLARHLGLARP